MILSNFISQENVIARAKLYSKKRIFETLASLLGGNSEVLQSIPSTDLYQKLNEREKIGSTAIGGGVVIPHCRSSLVKATRMALIILDSPVDYDAPDNISVDIFVALIFPDETKDIHLSFLSSLAKLFRNDSFKTDLRIANSKADLYNIILNSEEI